MKWLKETIELRSPTYKKEATAEAKPKTDWNAVNMKARARLLECHNYVGRWQNYKACMTHHFLSYRKRNMQVTKW